MSFGRWKHFNTSNSHCIITNVLQQIQTRFINIGQRMEKASCTFFFQKKIPPVKSMINSTFNSFPKTRQEGDK